MLDRVSSEHVAPRRIPGFKRRQNVKQTYHAPAARSSVGTRVETGKTAMDETVTEHELRHKDEELKKLLEELKRSKLDSATNRNSARAAVEVNLLLGHYKEKPPKWAPNQSVRFREWSPEKSKTFAVETRRDGLHTRFNTDSILNRLKRIDNIERTLIRIEVAVVLCLLALVYLGVSQAFGWRFPTDLWNAFQTTSDSL